jgi:hypothetical protein
VKFKQKYIETKGYERKTATKINLKEVSLPKDSFLFEMIKNTVS